MSSGGQAISMKVAISSFFFHQFAHYTIVLAIQNISCNNQVASPPPKCTLLIDEVITETLPQLVD